MTITLDELIRAEENAGNFSRRWGEQLARHLDDIMATIEAQSAWGGDRRTLLDRYQSSTLMRRIIFKAAPANGFFGRYREADERGIRQVVTRDLITNQPISQESNMQAVGNGMDPIRLWNELGMSLHKRSVLGYAPGGHAPDYGGLIAPLPTLQNFSRLAGSGRENNDRFDENLAGTYNALNRYYDKFKTYEPPDSVNIIWNFPGTIRGNEGIPRRVWAKSNRSRPHNPIYDDSLNWALATQRRTLGEDTRVWALTEQYGAYDSSDRNAPPLSKQLVVRNRLPQPAGQDAEVINFNMAESMIALSLAAMPSQPSWQESTLDPIYIQAMDARGPRGLADQGPPPAFRGRLTIAMCAAMGFIDDEDPAIGPVNFSRTIGTFTREDNVVVDFSIPQGPTDTLTRLQQVDCNTSDVYYALRKYALDNVNPPPANEDGRVVDNRPEIFRQPGGAIKALNALDIVVKTILLPTAAGLFAQRGVLETYRTIYSLESFFRSELNNFVDFNFADFVVEAPWSTDRYTEAMRRATGAQGNARSRSAYINPEYNYYNEKYELASSQVPESLLPNMYIYNLAAGSSKFTTSIMGDFGYSEDYRNFQAFSLDGANAFNNDLPQQSIDANNNAVSIYDKLITLDQFSNNVMPALDGDGENEDERERFVNFLERYAEATTGQNVTIDFMANISRQYYNQATPPDELDMYDNFNSRKKYFPMFVEVGVPTISPLGDFGKMVLSQDDPDTEEVDYDLGLTNNALINSILTSSFTQRHYTEHSCGLVARTFDPSRFRGVEQDRMSNLQDFIPRMVRTKKSTNLKMYDYDTWVENLKLAVRGSKSDANALSQISFRGPNIANTQRANVNLGLVQTFIDQITAEIEDVALDKMVKYDELAILRSKLVCESETIMYKLVKRDPFNDNEVLQNYFFPNTGTDRLIRFVDTQVKHGKRYDYELYAYDVVYGSTFRFRTRYARYPEIQENWSPRLMPQNGSNWDNEYIQFSFNVETLPNIQIAEYPIYTMENLRVLAAAAGRQRSWLSDLFAPYFGDIGGVSYPYAYIVGRPPMTPDVSIFPYQGDHSKILINLKPEIGELTGEKAVKFVPVLEKDNEWYSNMSQVIMQNENFTLPNGFMEFKSEGVKEITKMQIFRSMEMNLDVMSVDDMYKSFNNMVYKTLDISLEPDDPSGNYAKAFDFIDDIEPNKNYYYAFRSVDVHDNVSNPTEVYRVKINSKDNGVYPEIEIVNLSPKRPKVPTKNVRRYLEIKAADIQSLPYVEAAESDIATSVRCLVQNDTDNLVENNKFLIRLTSKDTGRKIDIETSFNVKQENE